MGDEVDRRVMEATEALVSAFDALREARLALDDPRLASGVEQQRNQGFSQATNRIEGCAKRAEEALRRSIVAASVGRSPAAFACYRQADTRFAGARGELRGAGRESDPSGRAAHLSVALALIEQGLDATKDLIFNASDARSDEQRTAQDGGAVFAPVGPRY
jgi:hypothetical protein